MADSRKRDGPSGSSFWRERKRRYRRSDEHSQQQQQQQQQEQLRRRQHQQQRATFMTALTAVVVVASVVASGVAHAHAPPVRAPIYEPRRLSWEYHESDLDERDGWRRSYRMDKQTFYKLAELLRPLLEVNTYFARECRGLLPVEWQDRVPV